MSLSNPLSGNGTVWIRIDMGDSSAETYVLDLGDSYVVRTDVWRMSSYTIGVERNETSEWALKDTTSTTVLATPAVRRKFEEMIATLDHLKIAAKA